MASQILARTVTRILGDATIQRINFVLSGLAVHSFRYEMVARAIANGKISCEVGVTPNRNLQAGYNAECRYEPNTRQLRFPNDQYGLNPGRETFNIVHEATHAVFDRAYGNPRGVQILAIDDEAAAFLAQAVYSRISPYMWGGPIPQGDPIDEALKLADKIMAVPNTFRGNSPPYHVPPAELVPLRRSIQTAYNFVGGAAGIQHVYYGIPS